LLPFDLEMIYRTLIVEQIAPIRIILASPLFSSPRLGTGRIRSLFPGNPAGSTENHSSRQRQRSARRQNHFAVSVSDLPDGKTISPSASAICQRQNHFAVAVNDLPGSKTVSPSA
jgi:hypothetical protein